MAIVKLSAGERRRLSAFLTCLVLAALAWVITNLSSQYDFKVKRAITFKNTPQKRAFHPLQPDTTTVTMKGTGWQMLLSKMNNNVSPITVDLRPLDNGNYVVMSTQMTQIADTKDTTQQIVAFDPDTLFFDFTNRMVKKVPVRLVSRITYQAQFAQANGAIIKPAYIILTGPAARIQNITEWVTDTLAATDVNKTIRTQLNLQPVSEGNISVYPKSVGVVVPVDEFTEKVVQVPVRLINNPDYFNVKIFPQKVKLTFVTALRKYAETDADFFEAQADLNLWHQGYNTLPVKLTRFPPYCKIVSIYPPNIDFIIRK